MCEGCGWGGGGGGINNQLHGSELREGAEVVRSTEKPGDVIIKYNKGARCVQIEFDMD